VSGIGFRLIGFALYLYSLYSMYNNALDECRFSMLQFCLEQSLSVGHWWPLILGEFANTIVSMVLVFTLFFIYTNLEQPAELILNAVAVNFLGSVDSEFVDSDTGSECVANFKELMERFKYQPPDEDTGGYQKRCTQYADMVLKSMLGGMVITGTILAFIFLCAPTQSIEARMKELAEKEKMMQR